MKQPTIVYVDDEQSALDLMKFGLEQKGYCVQTFLSGHDALAYLTSATPDLIVADLRMHPMNGFEFFQTVKKNSRMAAIPFLFLTAVDDHLAQSYSQTLGVDAYIVKPLDLDLFETMVRTKINKG